MQSPLEASVRTKLDYFGSSVSASDNRVLVGARYADVYGRYSGAAYGFHRNAEGTWREQGLLPTAPNCSDCSTNWQFGASVAVHADVAVVGASSYGRDNWDWGAAYFYRLGTEAADPAPVIRPIVDQSIRRGDTLVETLVAFDVSSDSVTFSKQTGPNNIELEPLGTHTAKLVWKPGVSYVPGTYEITIGATDAADKREP